MTDDGLPVETADIAQTDHTAHTARSENPGPIDAFASRARTEFGDSIRHLVAFGPAVTGDDAIRTEADLLLVLENEAVDCERPLRELAHDVGLERGVVLSVHVLPVDRFEANEDHPFVREAFDGGVVYS